MLVNVRQKCTKSEKVPMNIKKGIEYNFKKQYLEMSNLRNLILNIPQRVLWWFIFTSLKSSLNLLYQRKVPKHWRGRSWVDITKRSAVLATKGSRAEAERHWGRQTTQSQTLFINRRISSVSTKWTVKHLQMAPMLQKTTTTGSLPQQPEWVNDIIHLDKVKPTWRKGSGAGNNIWQHWGWQNNN